MGIFLFVRPEQKLTKEKLLRRPTALRCAVRQRNACFPPQSPAPSPSVFTISNSASLGSQRALRGLHALHVLA
jgi:hypothetical protein